MISQYPTTTKIAFADTVALDAFGRQRVSQANTLFDAQQEYGLDTLRIWDAVANGTYSAMSSNGSVSSGGNSVGQTDINTRMTPITCSSTNGHYAILQSRQYIRYIPAKSHLIFMTGIFAPASSEMAIVRRTSTSGSVVDNEVLQSNWNIDKFDGTGKSGVTLDFTKTQILVIQAQWLGVGRVIVGFDVNGILYPAHEFLNANVLTVPYTQTFNLPVRCEIRQDSFFAVARSGYFDSGNGIFLKAKASQLGGTIYMICCSVQSEGGQEIRGFPLSTGTAVSSSAAARRAILSIRPKATFNGRVNRGHIEISDLEITAATNSSYFEVVIGGTLGGTPVWNSVGDNSIVEFDTAGTTVTGGITISSGFVLSGSGSSRTLSKNDIATRSPFTLRQVDLLAANQDNLSIVCTPFTGTSNLTASLNWFEQTV